jgi:hypothetical protein
MQPIARAVDKLALGSTRHRGRSSNDLHIDKKGLPAQAIFTEAQIRAAAPREPWNG